MTTVTTSGVKAAATKRVAATGAAMSFDKQLKHARELVTEGRRLLHAANRNLNVGTVLVRRTHQRLNDTEAYFRRTRQIIRPAGR
ncbi:MAG TPA: hypothetical protein VGC86_01730 [Afipia sp.]